MKFIKREKILIAILAMGLGVLVGINMAYAQTYTTDTTSQSASGAISNSGSVAISDGGSGGTGVGASNFTVNPSVSINSTGSDLSESVPIVTAPQMTVLGGDDSCLKSRSGGGAFSGFGASFGTMVMDNECNRRRMHSYLAAAYPNVAMEILCGSPIVWAAFSREGKATGMSNPCDNDQPTSANEIDPGIVADEFVAAGPTATADDYLAAPNLGEYKGKTLYYEENEEDNLFYD